MNWKKQNAIITGGFVLVVLALILAGRAPIAWAGFTPTPAPIGDPDTPVPTQTPPAATAVPIATDSPPPIPTFTPTPILELPLAGESENQSSAPWVLALGGALTFAGWILNRKRRAQPVRIDKTNRHDSP